MPSDLKPSTTADLRNLGSESVDCRGRGVCSYHLAASFILPQELGVDGRACAMKHEPQARMPHPADDEKSKGNMCPWSYMYKDHFVEQLLLLLGVRQLLPGREHRLCRASDQVP